MASSEVRMAMLDGSGESSSVTFYVPAIAADGANYASITGALGDIPVLGTAIDALCGLTHTKTTMSITLDQNTAVLPAVSEQREDAVRISYQDTVTFKKYRFDIPAPVDAIFQAGTDVVDIVSNVTFLAFSAVFNANAVSPDGNAVVIIGARRVGRHN